MNKELIDFISKIDDPNKLNKENLNFVLDLIRNKDEEKVNEPKPNEVIHIKQTKNVHQSKPLICFDNGKIIKYPSINAAYKATTVPYGFTKFYESLNQAIFNNEEYLGKYWDWD